MGSQLIVSSEPNFSIARLTSKQILPFAFEEQHSAVSAYFTSKQKLPFVIQEYSDPEKPRLVRNDGCLRNVIAPLLTTLGMLCPNFGYSSMFRRSYVQKVLCSEGSMFRRSFAQKVLCSEGSMFRRFYIQKVLCSEGPMFRNICSEGPMFRKYAGN